MTRIAISIATVGFIGLLACTEATAEGATAPYNEAVKIVDGRRVVELPPSPSNLRAAAAALRPAGPGTSRTVIETMEGLMDCKTSAYDPHSCVSSTYGKSVEHREWLVKLDGKWQRCVSRAKPTKCIPAWGAFAALPTNQE